MTSTRQKHQHPQRRLRRSRFGCRNCKLRKIKCDEDKPQCRRCQGFGLLCNFMSHVADLQSVVDDSIGQAATFPKEEPQPPVSTAIWTLSASSFYQLSAKCQDLIMRYLGRSLLSPDDPNMAKINGELLTLAFNYPFLMHASLGVAFAYDHSVNNSSSGRRSLEECYHWFQSTSLFNKRLMEPVNEEDKDAIWGTAAALTILAVSSPDASKPEESWPLNPSEASNLEWLRMSKGKMSLWQVTDPLRPSSLFRIMAETYAEMNTPMPGKGIDGIPPALAIVCQLEELSTPANNAYFNTAHAVSHIQNLPDSEVSVGQTELFIRSIDDNFGFLLREKDPVALLLLYLWYQKAGRSIWWIGLRARIECPSICSYLQVYHKDYDAVQIFLPGEPFIHRWL